MACTAILLPCDSSGQETLPQGTLVEDVLSGPLLCTTVDSSRRLHWSACSAQVNAAATAVAGFMVQGDALIVQQPANTPQPITAQQGTSTLSSVLLRTSTETSSSSSSSQSGIFTDTKQHSVLLATPSRRKPSTLPASAHSDGAHTALARLDGSTKEAETQPQLDVFGSLQGELLGHVLQQVSWSSREAIALSSVCRSWRMGMCADKAFLTAIPVFIDPKTPYKPAQTCDCCRGASEMIRNRRHAHLPLPFVITKAASAGNVSANVCAAQIMERRGDMDAAMKFWGKAARQGHPEGQYKLGKACYQGAGMVPDAQDAMLWLSRAAKTLLAYDPSGESIGNMSVARLITRRNQLRDDDTVWLGAQDAIFTTSCSLTWRDSLAKTALLLGFLHLDGEATKFDAGEGLKWFKIALLHECTEAERIIGTLFNTGQYG